MLCCLRSFTSVSAADLRQSIINMSFLSATSISTTTNSIRLSLGIFQLDPDKARQRIVSFIDRRWNSDEASATVSQPLQFGSSFDYEEGASTLEHGQEGTHLPSPSDECGHYALAQYVVDEDSQSTRSSYSWTRSTGFEESIFDTTFATSPVASAAEFAQAPCRPFNVAVSKKSQLVYIPSSSPTTRISTSDQESLELPQWAELSHGAEAISAISGDDWQVQYDKQRFKPTPLLPMGLSTPYSDQSQQASVYEVHYPFSGLEYPKPLPCTGETPVNMGMRNDQTKGRLPVHETRASSGSLPCASDSSPVWLSQFSAAKAEIANPIHTSDEATNISVFAKPNLEQSRNNSAQMEGHDGASGRERHTTQALTSSPNQNFLSQKKVHTLQAFPSSPIQNFPGQSKVHILQALHSSPNQKSLSQEKVETDMSRPQGKRRSPLAKLSTCQRWLDNIFSKRVCKTAI